MFEKGDKPVRSAVRRDAGRQGDTPHGAVRIDGEPLAMLQANVTSIPNATAVFDEDYNIVCVNDYFLRLWGYRRESEVLGLFLGDLWDNAAITMTIRDCLRVSGDWSGELVGNRAVGMPVDVHVSARLSGKASMTPGYVFVSFVDISERKRAEDAVRQNEERFRHIAELTTDIIFEVDADGTITFMTRSETGASYAGTGVLLGGNYFDRMEKSETQGFSRSEEGRMAEREIWEQRLPYVDFETNVTSPDGSQKTWSVNGLPQFDKLGSFLGYRMSQRDISDRVAADKQIHQQSLVMQQMTDAVIIIGSDGIVRDTNTALERVFGYARADVIGPLEHSELAVMMSVGSLPMERVKGSFPAKGFWVDEVTLLHKDGSPVIAEMSTISMAETAGNNADRALVIRDITEHKNAELDLRQSERRVRGMVESVSFGVATIDQFGTVGMFNPAAVKIFGYRAGDVIGKNISMLMSGPDRHMHDEKIDNYIKTGVGSFIGWGSREVMGLHRDGREFPLELSIAEMNVSGARTFIGSFLDVTERKKTEKQLQQSQKMEAVGQLTGGIAHDFNNMLGGMMLNIEMLGEDIEDQPAAQNTLRALSTAVDGGSALTRRLLSFSRQQSLEAELADVNAVAGSLEDLLSHAFADNITLEKIFGPNPWLTHIDVNQLENAILNLSLNAMDAMPEGGTLTITTTNYVVDTAMAVQIGGASAGDYVRVSVSDTGTGMPQSILDHVLEPFFTTKESGKGTGLGLSMVDHFVQQSGGAFTILSEEGVGTSMEMYFPKADDIAGDAESAVSESPTPNPTPEAVSPVELTGILVIEGNQDIQAIMVGAITKLGYEVGAVSDAHTALDWIESNGGAPALVLSDIDLPGDLGGLDMAVQVQETWPTCKFVFMTGSADVDDSDREDLADSVDILAKPFSQSALQKKIKEVLGY